MRTLVALTLAALGCGAPVSSPPVYSYADAGADAADVASVDAADAATLEGCDAQVQGTIPGILCRGDAATADSPGVAVAGGLCVSPAWRSNCGTCGNHCEDGRVCVDDPQGSNTGWRCRYPQGL